MKKTIRLTENDLHNIIKKTLNEMKWGFGNPAFDRAYDKWRTRSPYDDEYDPEDEEKYEEELYDEPDYEPDYDEMRYERELGESRKRKAVKAITESVLKNLRRKK